MMHLVRKLETPPDKFRYTFRQDGHRVSSFSYDGWLTAIQKHAQDNGYTLPMDWVQQAEAQLCETLPAGWCRHSDGSAADSGVDYRIGMQDVLNGTKVLVEFVKRGLPLVEQAEAEQRGKTCAGCHFLVSAAGCGPCMGLSNLVEEVAAAKSTDADQILSNKACLLCHCVARAHIWLPIEVLARGTTAEQFSKAPEWCWKKQGLETL